MASGDAEASLAVSLEQVTHLLAGKDVVPTLRRLEVDASGLEEMDSSIESLHLVLEWGAPQVFHYIVEYVAFVGDGRMATVEGFCNGEGQVVLVEDHIYGSRPFVDPKEVTCDLGEEGEAIVEVFEDWDLEGVQGTRRNDGSRRLVYDDGDDRFVVELDALGRTSSIELESPWVGDWRLRFEYGPRRAIVPPTATLVLPALVVLDDRLTGDAGTAYQVVSSPQPLRTEFEVQVRSTLWKADGTHSSGSWQRSLNEFAAFDVSVDGVQTLGNLSFEYLDHDADGRISIGDEFVLTDLDPDPQLGDYIGVPGAYLYDKVAGADVNSGVMGVPGFGLLAALGAILAASRRH